MGAERGMVTAELAVASLLVAVVVVVVGWLVGVLGLAVRCQDTAWEVARQEARGDREASLRARAGAPPGARVAVARGGDQVQVVVELDAKPWLGWLPAVPLRARAATLSEPEPER
ncbi:MAG: TadE family type IV pilus minor pilin [Propionicimonas sp.]|nr:TadE family type IV pilus minor pilin [Propionicimonas sp.]